jgi:hypothetical protein
MVYYGDHAPQLAGSVIALASIGYIVFGLRIYTRLHHGAWGLDDWCMTAATVSAFHRRSRRRLADSIDTIHGIDDSMHRRCIQWDRTPQLQVDCRRSGIGNAGMTSHYIE